MTPPASFEETTATNVRTLTVIVVVLAIFLGVSLPVVAYAVITGHDAISRVETVARGQGADARRAATLAAQEAVVAHRANALANEIVAQRDQTILRSCVEQDSRHTHTIRVLNRILGRAERSSPPVQRAQIRESRASTVLLINQLAPYQNCQKQLKLDKSTK